MSDPRIVVWVSSDPSDLYFANQITKQANVVGVLVEQHNRRVGTLNQLAAVLRYLKSPAAFCRKLFAAATRKYYATKARKISRAGFGTEGYQLNRPENCPALLVDKKQVVSCHDYAQWIMDLQPDAIAVCGASILNEPILSITPNIINLHSGLSQKYRGEWTTLWAIYNEEPEYVGYTVHFVAAGIDDGDIIRQGRPVISADDNHETLYVKVVKLGTAALLNVLEDVAGNALRGRALPQKGKLYPRDMLTPAIIRSTWQKVAAGLIREYVKHPKSVILIGN